VNTLVRSTLLWMLIAGGAALAQTPDCPCPVPTGPPPLWTGSAEFSYLSTSGNSSSSSLGGGLELFYKPAPWTFSLNANYLRSSSRNDATGEKELTAEQFRGGLKGARDLTERLDIYAGGTYLRNTFAGLDSLIGIGAGAGYKLFNTPSQFLRVEGGFGYTWENQTIDFDRNYANAHLGVGYKWTFSKTAAFTNDFGVLLDLADTNNWIISDTAAVTATLTSVLAIKASWTILYRKEPVPGFKKTDTATAVSLVAKF
jgi:putative salt-induced outer membrane protein